jgi:hypothetical protein
LPLQNVGPNQWSWQRVGRYNNRGSQDWQLAAPTLGSQNAGLDFPFFPEETVWPVLPASVTLSNGIWSGTIAVNRTNR